MIEVQYNKPDEGDVPDWCLNCGHQRGEDGLITPRETYTVTIGPKAGNKHSYNLCKPCLQDMLSKCLIVLEDPTKNT